MAQTKCDPIHVLRDQYDILPPGRMYSKLMIRTWGDIVLDIFVEITTLTISNTHLFDHHIYKMDLFIWFLKQFTFVFNT